jgi:Peptidase family M28
LFGAAEPRLRPLALSVANLSAEIADAVSSDRIRADVEAISGPRSRISHDDVSQFEAYIERRFNEAGWCVRRQDFEFSDASIIVGDDGHRLVYATSQKLSGTNLIAHLDSEDAGLGDAVIIGAHFDTVKDSPGADDNGSGVAALLELARLLAGLPLGIRVRLVAFDLEEAGFFGSRAVAEEVRAANDSCAAVVYECIGYSANARGSQRLPAGVGLVYRQQVRRMKRRSMVGDETVVIYRGSSDNIARNFAECLAHVAGRQTVVLVRDPVDLPLLGKLLTRAAPWVKHFARSDHVPFWAANQRAIQVTDTANMRNPHYHRPSDLPETLDYKRIAQIVAATALMLSRMGGT